ncbi:MAG: glycosyl hydrolase [Chthoniobacteraceae bacterium]
MHLRSPILSIIATAASLTCLHAADLTTASSAPKIVACDANVPSQKRGVCANKLDAADFRALAPGVSWYYTWHFEPTSTPPSDANIEFLPMCWGADETRLNGLKNYLAGGHHPRAVLALNEPNLKGQAFIPPEKAAEYYTKIKAVADQYHLPTVGPHMAIGSPTGSSITAMDPITHTQTTYSFMTPYLKAFLYYTDASHTDVGPLGVHSYGNIGELKWVVEMTYKEFHRPVWVTEYAWWGAPNVDEARKYLMEATDFLENNPHVAGYAWFKERADNPKISLLEKSPGVLSPLGQAYVAMPAHDPNIFFRIPGKLAATRYANSNDISAKETKDPGAFLQVESNGDGSSVDYNLASDTGGNYHVKIRVLGHAGKVLEFYNGTTKLASATLAKDGWQEVETDLTLAKGPQTIQLKLPLVALNWLEFTAK